MTGDRTSTLGDRTWGDGAHDERAHLIGDVSYVAGAIACVPCGVIVEQGRFLSLERAWSEHRGLAYHAPRYDALATDSEVVEFLRRVEDPTYESSMAGSHAVARGAPDLEAAFDLLARLTGEHERLKEETACL